MSDMFQMCLVFGNKNWTRRQSTHAALSIVALANDYAMSDCISNSNVRYCCIEFVMYQTCAHVEAIISNKSNALRILSIPRWCETKFNDFRASLE